MSELHSFYNLRRNPTLCDRRYFVKPLQPMTLKIGLPCSFSTHQHGAITIEGPRRGKRDVLRAIDYQICQKNEKMIFRFLGSRTAMGEQFF